MGIYSKDRTMLTIDPTAKSRPIPGYTSASDLYKIMEETLASEFETFDSLIESEMSMVRLDEAEAAKTDSRLKSINKLCDSITKQLVNASAKTKSVCAAVNKKAAKFSGKGDVIDKYAAKFEGNKDIMTTSHFEMKYNKCALECTNKEIVKFVKEAGNAGSIIAKNAASIAKANAEEINKNRHNVFKVPALGKYADKFCCCCDEKKETVSGNPFSGSVKPGNIVAEIKSAPKVNFEAAMSSMDSAFATLVKQVNKIKSDAEKAKEIKAEDLAQLHAIAAIAEGLVKAYIHTINDAFKCYSEHVKECVKVYIAASNIKAVKEGESVVYRSTIASLMEADLFANDFDFFLENEEIDYEEAIEDESDTDEFYPDDNDIEEGCCKEEAEEVSSEEPDSSDGDVKSDAEKAQESSLKETDEVDNDHSAPAKETEELNSSDANVKPEEQESPQECGNVNCAADPFAGMNEFEAAAQLSLMAETNWIIMLEELEDSEYDKYRQNILAKNMLEEEALEEANEAGSMKERFIASVNKISEYIKNLFARLVATIANTLTKYKFLFSKESMDRQATGCTKLIDNKTKISGQILKANAFGEGSIYESKSDAVLGRCDEIVTSTASLKLDNIIESTKKDISEGKENLVDIFLDNIDEEISKSSYDKAITTLKNYNERKDYFKSTYVYYDTEVKRYIDKLKKDTAFEKKEDAGERFKVLHGLNKIIIKLNSAGVSALSKDFTTSCRIVLMCYNAGKGSAKTEEKEEPKGPAPRIAANPA